MTSKICIGALLFSALTLHAQQAPELISCTLKTAKQTVQAAIPVPVAYQTRAQHPCCQRPMRHSISAARAELARSGAQELTLQTTDQHQVRAYHLKHGSDTLIIAACGFPACKEQMIPDVALFAPYDLIIFDYRWREPGYYYTLQTLIAPVQRIVLDCMHDVQAVLAYAHAAGYRQIIGHGICFSAGLFALINQQAQRNGQPGFDKLILDSCWLSLTAFADTIIKDPYLLWCWGKGGSPLIIKIFMRLLYLPLYGLCYLCLPTVDVINALRATPQTPLLLIHGAHDALIPIEKFEHLWRAIAHDRAQALITPYGHSNSYTKNPGLYAACCDAFIKDVSLQATLGMPTPT